MDIIVHLMKVQVDLLVDSGGEWLNNQSTKQLVKYAQQLTKNFILSIKMI